MNKIIYTVITNDKDDLKEQPKYEGWEYLAFTDREYDSDTWTIVQYKSDQEDPRRKSREPKIYPERYFQYDKCLYIDATMILTENPDNYFQDGIGLIKHPYWDTIGREAEEIVKRGLDTKENVNKSLKYYRNPKEKGLYMNGLIARTTSDKMERLNKFWWHRYLDGSIRDQMTLKFCLQATETTPYELPSNIIKRFGHKK